MEFHPCHQTAFAIAGTVPLPSPYPASGAVSVVIARDGEEFEVFVKILQVVSDRRIITRLVRPEDIRAIRGYPEGTDGGGPESWPVLGIKKIAGELESRARELRARAAKTGILDEAPWYHAAIVYVAEAAPVLHRNEVGVTAAVSSEEVGFGDLLGGCCYLDVVGQPAAFSDHRAARALSACCHFAGGAPAPERRSAKDRD
jgi:hypothetical protein